MSQFDFGNLESPLSGTDLINGNLEPWRDALHSGHMGATRPDYAVEGLEWIDNSSTPWILKRFTGSDDAIIGTIDTVTNIFSPAGVSQAATDISYDNSGSGLAANNVQDAIDESYNDFDSFANRPAGFATAAQGAKADTALQAGGLTLKVSDKYQELTGSSTSTIVATPNANPPANNQGLQVFSFTHAAQDANNKINIFGNILLSANSNYGNVAVFKDGVLLKNFANMSQAGYLQVVPFDLQITAGDTNSHTYTIRASSTVTTLYLNAYSNVSSYANTLTSYAWG